MATLSQRLYRGDLNIDFIGRARLWYKISAVVMLVCIASMVFRGFNFGIEFEGGNSFQFPGTEQQLDQVAADVEAAGVEVGSAQVVGTNQILLRTAELDNDTAARVTEVIGEAVGIGAGEVSNSSVSPRWGSDITSKALQSLAVFLVLVVAFIALRFQPKMAVAALVALVNDLIVAAGVYSLVGFEVTPSTVIGLLTILGFSLYDTVVVFDKVDENTRGILGGSRTTYSEAANLAVNQTLMRSINTSLIALLPVAGLLFVGAGLLGAGTLKDLALVLFVGLATGAYSSIFLATPILCDLKEREPAHVALTKRVQARRSSGRDSEPAVRPSKTRPGRGSSRAPAAGAKPARATTQGAATTALLDKPEPAAERPASPPVASARRSRSDLSPAVADLPASRSSASSDVVRPSGSGTKGAAGAASTSAPAAETPATPAAGSAPAAATPGKGKPAGAKRPATPARRGGKPAGKRKR